MSKQDTRPVEVRERKYYSRLAEQREDRLNETITRRELIETIESIANQYGSNGTHESDLICDAFRRLAQAFK